MKIVTFDRPKGASEEKGDKVKEVLNSAENLLQYVCHENAGSKGRRAVPKGREDCTQFSYLFTAPRKENHSQGTWEIFKRGFPQ